jgi:hypothetical protein
VAPTKANFDKLPKSHCQRILPARFRLHKKFPVGAAGAKKFRTPRPGKHGSQTHRLAREGKTWLTLGKMDFFQTSPL